MNRPVPRAISRAAFIAAAILIAYLIFSALSLFIGRGSWIPALATVAIILAFAIPFVDRAFGDKLPFLGNWPTTSINARIRRILGHRYLGGGNSFNNPQTGKQVAVNLLWVFSIFLFLLAVTGIRLLLGRPISDTLANILGAVFMSSAAMAAFQFMALRLRAKYDLRSVLQAIAIYAPMTMVAIGLFLVWGEIIDNDSIRISRGIMLFPLCASIVLTALMALIHNRRKSDAPVPTFTTHPYYKRAEIAVSIAAIAAVSTIFLFSS